MPSVNQPPITYQPDSPDSQTVRVTFVDSDFAVENWLGYDFSSDFLTPTDSFNFQLGLDENGMSEDQRRALKLGARIRLHVNDNILADGRVDHIDISADRGSGIVYTIHGRDRLGQTLDTIADPTFQLKSGGTLEELLKRLFTPFGWSDETQFEVDTAANRDARKGGARGTPTTKGGKKKGPKPLKKFVLHQTKPYNHESVFHFASRISQREGLWIWCSADGEQLMIGKPDFDQPPAFKLRRSADGRGNVLSGTVSYNLTDQPTILFADGFSGGGEFGKGRVKAYAINPVLGFTDNGARTPEVTAIIAKYKGATEVKLPSARLPFATTGIQFRPMFLHDDESKTQAQLENYVRREMSLLYRKVLTANYVVEGHGQSIDNDFIAWTPDTTVEVEDEVAELREILYVLGVSYHKSRQGGTTTRLELVRKNSIIF